MTQGHAFSTGSAQFEALKMDRIMCVTAVCVLVCPPKKRHSTLRSPTTGSVIIPTTPSMFSIDPNRTAPPLTRAEMLDNHRICQCELSSVTSCCIFSRCISLLPLYFLTIVLKQTINMKRTRHESQTCFCVQAVVA